MRMDSDVEEERPVWPGMSTYEGGGVWPVRRPVVGKTFIDAWLPEIHVGVWRRPHVPKSPSRGVTPPWLAGPVLRSWKEVVASYLRSEILHGVRVFVRSEYSGSWSSWSSAGRAAGTGSYSPEKLMPGSG